MTKTIDPPRDAALMPIGRYEWERLVRRIVMPKPHKLLAFVLATYADSDGTRVRPGNDVLADVTGDSEKNVRRILGALRELGLLSLVSRGGGRGGRGKASQYRLTIPDDLLDRVTLLDADDRKSPDIWMSGQSDLHPVDNANGANYSPDTQMSAEKSIDRTFSSIDRTSRCPTTTHVTNHQKTTTPTEHPTQPQTVRARVAVIHRGFDDRRRLMPPLRPRGRRDRDRSLDPVVRRWTRRGRQPAHPVPPLQSTPQQHLHRVRHTAAAAGHATMRRLPEFSVRTVDRPSAPDGARAPVRELPPHLAIRELGHRDRAGPNRLLRPLPGYLERDQPWPAAMSRIPMTPYVRCDHQPQRAPT
jgi:hypothetical protein